MSANKLQTKIDKAHKKIGAKLGYTFGLYRPLNNVDVLDEANWIADIDASFTVNDSFTEALNWNTPVWTCYTDASQLQEGDFLYSEDLNRTFHILTRQPLLPVMALECPDKVDIQVVGYGDDGTGFAPGKTTFVAKNLPGYVSYGAVNQRGHYPGEPRTTIAGVRTITFITSLPKSFVLQGMTISEAGGFSGDIISYDYAPYGNSVKITAQEFSPVQG